MQESDCPIYKTCGGRRLTSEHKVSAQEDEFDVAKHYDLMTHRDYCIPEQGYLNCPIIKSLVENAAIVFRSLLENAQKARGEQ